MQLLNLIGVHCVTQIVLLLIAWQFGPWLQAIHELFSYSRSLFFFYLIGMTTIALLVWTTAKQTLFLSSVGRKAKRAAAIARR